MRLEWMTDRRHRQRVAKSVLVDLQHPTNLGDINSGWGSGNDDRLQSHSAVFDSTDVDFHQSGWLGEAQLHGAGSTRPEKTRLRMKRYPAVEMLCPLDIAQRRLGGKRCDFDFFGIVEGFDGRIDAPTLADPCSDQKGDSFEIVMDVHETTIGRTTARRVPRLKPR